MPEDHFSPVRDQIVDAFDGPGIDPPTLDNGDDEYGWISQSRDVRLERIVSAAVLVPLVERPDGITVMLTQRTGHLKSPRGPGVVSRWQDRAA